MSDMTVPGWIIDAAELTEAKRELAQVRSKLADTRIRLHDLHNTMLAMITWKALVDPEPIERALNRILANMEEQPF